MIFSSHKAEKIRTRNKLFSLLLSLFYAVLITVLIRAVWVQPFNIPSSSMVPTLLVGDYIIATKYDYGYSSSSLFLPAGFFNGRLFESLPELGDVVVFRMSNGDYYVKRVMALPGDTIQVREGVVYINDIAVPRVLKGSMVFRLRARVADLYEETLPGGTRYMTLDAQGQSFSDNTPSFRVPEGHVFMLGDNRDYSLDSRRVGFIPLESLVGRVRRVYFSYGLYDPQTKVRRFFVRWGRLFQKIR